MCIWLQGKELKAENDELKDGIVKRDVEVQHLKVKVCGCVVHLHVNNRFIGLCLTFSLFAMHFYSVMKPPN